MRVIQGKQAVLRPYLSEKQCVRPVQGQAAVPVKPIDYAVKGVSVRKAEVSEARECFVQAAETQTLSTHDQAIENAVVRNISAVSLCSEELSLETGRMVDITEEENLTIEKLFAQHAEGRQ